MAIILAAYAFTVIESVASIVIVVLLFGGIMGIGIVVGHCVSYWVATILAIGWAILILRLRDRIEQWIE